MQSQQSVCARFAKSREIVPQYLRIKGDKNPIFIWGCGAFAIRVYHYCRHYEIPIAGVFVNVPEERTEFEGLPVFKMERLAERCPKFSVIIGHANYRKGSAYLRGLEQVENIYCVTSCCYDIWNLVSQEFLTEHEEALNRFYNELQDEASKACFTSYFESRVNDDPAYMFPCYEGGTGYYQNDIFTLGDQETLLDIGACVGNSIWPFVDAVRGSYRAIIALEPEEHNFRLLRENIRDRGIPNVVVRQVCAYDREGFVKFDGEQEQGGIQENAEHYRLCPAVTLDGLCRELNAGVSILKINFPFSVPQILNGARTLLRERKPKVIIRAGFDETVLMETYEAIKALNPDYRMYLRYTVGIPQGLTIFAV